VAHVELSLSEAFLPQRGTPLDSGADPAPHPTEPQPGTPPEPESDSFTRWSVTVSKAAEPCLLIDLGTTIAAISTSCCELLGLGSPTDVVGRKLLDGGLRLLDFTAARAELTEQETDKIPPLLALSSGRLTRGLLRVQACRAGEPPATVDAIATPILASGVVAGSLTFLSGL
jgi:hypothetical protein